MIDIVSLRQRNNLAPYAQELLSGLIPILKRLDASQLSPSSIVVVEEQKRGFVLKLEIIASVENVPSLGLRAYPDQCILGFADSEQIEAHNIPPEWQYLVGRILTEIERYLNGITVVERYNRNHKLVGKIYFYGVDAEDNKDAKIGESSYLVFPRKVLSVVKRTHRFLK